MIDVKTILVPVDFSNASKQAIRHAFSLARQFQAKVVLAHIVPSGNVENYILPTESDAAELVLYDAAKHDLPKLIPAEMEGLVKVYMIVKIGEVDTQLLEIVSENNVDLVVMGTHGRRALARWLMGSVTERMLRKVPVPVLTVSHVEPGKELLLSDQWPIRRILYAVDLSEDSEAGFKLALKIGRAVGARVTVMHCVEPITGVWSGTMTTYLKQQYAERVKSAEKRLAGFVARNTPEDVAVDSVLVKGKPYEQILEVAKHRAFDLIVINLHSQTSYERAFLGSTSERVVRLAGVPVLAVPLRVDEQSPARISISV